MEAKWKTVLSGEPTLSVADQERHVPLPGAMWHNIARVEGNSSGVVDGNTATFKLCLALHRSCKYMLREKAPCLHTQFIQWLFLPD